MGIFSDRMKPKLIESKAGIISSPKDSPFLKVDLMPDNVKLQERYNNAYLNFPVVSGAIDTTADHTVQDFYFDGPGKNKLESFGEKQNLRQFFHRVCKQMLVQGNCYVELESEKKSRVVKNLKILDPRTMVVVRELTGKIVAYVQVINQKALVWGELSAKMSIVGDWTIPGARKKVGEVKDIAHFRYNVQNSEKYGTSIIHPILSLLALKEQVEKDMMVIVKRYAAPIIDISVGDEQHPPADNLLNDIKDDVENLHSATEFVHNYLAQVKTIGFEGKALNIEPVLAHLDRQIVAGLQIPPELLGWGGADKAMAEVRLRSFGRHCKSIQRQMRNEFEDKVIPAITGSSKNNKLIWDAVEEREKEQELDMIRGLKKDGIISTQKANDLLPEKYREANVLEELKKENEVKMMMNPNDPNADPRDKFNKGADAIKDNPTDPTKKRVTKTEEEVPIK